MLIVLFLTLFCSVVFRTAYCDVAIVAPEPNSVYDLSGTSQAVVKVKWMHTDNTPQEKDFCQIHVYSVFGYQCHDRSNGYSSNTQCE